MLSISSLIDFLLNLLRDDNAQAEFNRDPQAVLARHGLDGVTAQDVRDVQPLLADTAGVRCGDHNDRGSHHESEHHHSSRPAGDHHAGRGGHDDDPVREIHNVTDNHYVDNSVLVNHTTQNTFNEYNQYNLTDNSVTTGDGSTVIQDSFNQDNDGVDNKGGVINDSNVAGHDQTDVGNATQTTDVADSFNTDASDTLVVVDSGNDASIHSTTVDHSFDEGSSNSAAVNDSYHVNAPEEHIDATDAGIDPEHAAA